MKINNLKACPKCHKPISWQGNASRPFCSERCRLEDLGAWSDESYRVTEKSSEEPTTEWTDEGLT
ncbi:MAG: DNA gyrase inhibitor YacG [Holophagaceae bacterium]